jgi:hypothetical protein
MVPPGYGKIAVELSIESVDLNLSREWLMVDSVFRTWSTWLTPVNIQLLRIRSNKVNV